MLNQPGLPTLVKGDPTRLRQVLLNIISNSFQNTVRGGVNVNIKPLKIKDLQCVVSITVQDLGAGMSEKQLDDLFQDFEQILDEDDADEKDAKTPVDKNSLGVGLAVVARYVRNMNGQIKVRSELTKGTSFTVELPFERVAGSSLTDARAISNVYTTPTESNPGSIWERDIKSTSSYTTTSSPTEQLIGRKDSDIETVVLPLGALVLEDIQSSALPTTSTALTIQEKRAASQKSVSSGESTTYPFPNMVSFADDEPQRKMKILVAEDNPINARMLKKRLEKTGHEVHVVDDGQSCFNSFEQLNEEFYDVILMDLQMPLVDGHVSTRMIRLLERERELSIGETRYVGRNRVPIFAVSASLAEDQRFGYVQDGFDGWVLKPIDYSRLEILMQGVYDVERRRQAVYVPGRWEMGGWFMC